MADRKKNDWRKKIEEMLQERLVRRVIEEDQEDGQGKEYLMIFAYILLYRTVYIPIVTDII